MTILSLVLIAAWATGGALWRRAFGGWGGLSRRVTYVLSLPLSLLPLLVAAWGLPWPWLLGVTSVGAGLVLLFFVCGLWPGVIDGWRVWRKYGPFAAGYWAAWRWWPSSWRLGGFVDGANAVGELTLGGSFFAALALLFLV